MFKEFPEDDNKTDDFLNEFRQKISDQNFESLEEKREELKRSKSIFLGVAGGVLLAGIVGWIILVPQYRVESEKEIPVIRRPQTAIRVQPNEPGGMEIPNQDKSVYNIIEKKDDVSVENLLPPPEEPKLPAIASSETVASTDTSPLAEAEKIVQQSAPTNVSTEDIIKQAEKQIPAPQITPEDKTSKVAQEQSKPQPSVKQAPKAEIKQETKKDTKSVQDTKSVSEPVRTQTKAVAGDWQIQLMSSPNRAAVVKAQAEVSKKYKLSHLRFDIEAAVLDKNKTFYRLLTGAFKTRAEADRQCNNIKALGGTCIVKKK